MTPAYVLRLKKFRLMGLISLILFLRPNVTQSSDESEYDRLDGKGKSGMKVQVIEWEGNLELHIFPTGLTQGLALKLDKKNKDKPVMVIGYRFKGAPKTQLIRRATIGIELREGFKVYQDPSESDFDKFIITHNTLSAPLIAYAPEAEPKQLYPDGHPALAQANEPAKSAGAEPTARKPAEARAGVDENGTIQPFFSRPE